jgi:hypothetical protein
MNKIIKNEKFQSVFFSNYEVNAKNKYQLLTECVKFADSNGFKAVWTP